MQYESCWWYCWMHEPEGLWSGISARERNCLCSSLSGSANPLMIDPRICAARASQHADRHERAREAEARQRPLDARLCNRTSLHRPQKHWT